MFLLVLVTAVSGVYLRISQSQAIAAVNRVFFVVVGDISWFELHALRASPGFFFVLWRPLLVSGFLRLDYWIVYLQ